MTTERVNFRLIVMPCCQYQFCSVNPRLPNFCPECGTRIFPAVRSCVTFIDDNATLVYDSNRPIIALPLKGFVRTSRDTMEEAI